MLLVAPKLLILEVAQGASQFARQSQAFLKIEARAGDLLRELTLVKLWEFFEVRSDRIVHFTVRMLLRRTITLDRWLQFSFA